MLISKTIHTWQYLGYTCVIKIQQPGFYCGYVKLNHQPIEFDPYDLLECHGGITFNDTFTKPDQYLPEGEWVGFDCGHAWDGSDVELAWEHLHEEGDDKNYFIENSYYGMHDTQQFKSLEFVTQECEQLVDQLIELTRKTNGTTT